VMLSRRRALWFWSEFLALALVAKTFEFIFFVQKKNAHAHVPVQKYFARIQKKFKNSPGNFRFAKFVQNPFARWKSQRRLWKSIDVESVPNYGARAIIMYRINEKKRKNVCNENKKGEKYGFFVIVLYFSVME